MTRLYLLALMLLVIPKTCSEVDAQTTYSLSVDTLAGIETCRGTFGDMTLTFTADGSLPSGRTSLESARQASRSTTGCSR
jgi:hypothetical protein